MMAYKPGPNYQEVFAHIKGRKKGGNGIRDHTHVDVCCGFVGSNF